MKASTNRSLELPSARGIAAQMSQRLCIRGVEIHRPSYPAADPSPKVGLVETQANPALKLHHKQERCTWAEFVLKDDVDIFRPYIGLYVSTTSSVLDR